MIPDVLNRLQPALSGRYVVQRELGSGGMATVYLAHDLKLRRKVALKVVRPELAAALGAERFHREIEIAANLNHPHILPLLDSGTAGALPTSRTPDCLSAQYATDAQPYPGTDDVPTGVPTYRRTANEPSTYLYYTMPFVEGQSLREKLMRDGELPLSEAIRILRDITDALSHAHKRGIIHRDIKPENVMLSDHHALVTDFGVAKAVGQATDATNLTTEGMAVGTPTYMAPEQAAADRDIDRRADIYAVGVIAYELLTGRTLFVGSSQQQLLAAQIGQAPDPMTKHRESVPAELATMVAKCLEKKPADRWQTADEILVQLEAQDTPSGGSVSTEAPRIAAAVKTKEKAILGGRIGGYACCRRADAAAARQLFGTRSG